MLRNFPFNKAMNDLTFGRTEANKFSIMLIACSFLAIFIVNSRIRNLVKVDGFNVFT